MSGRWLQALVPRDWAPDQALGAVRLLRLAQDAIWAVHGEAMIGVIGDIDPRLEALDNFIDPDALEDLDGMELPYGDEDDIPF